MKKIVYHLSLGILLSAAVVFTACDKKAAKDGEKAEVNEAQRVEQSGEMPPTKIEFEEIVYDFGETKKGQKVVHNFKFKNTGDKDLVIATAKAGCGCTVPQWPKEAIKPGGTGEISVEYNGSGNGTVTKTVTVTANTEPANTVLTIKGNVKTEIKGPYVNQEN